MRAAPSNARARAYLRRRNQAGPLLAKRCQFEKMPPDRCILRPAERCRLDGPARRSWTCSSLPLRHGPHHEGGGEYLKAIAATNVAWSAIGITAPAAAEPMGFPRVAQRHADRQCQSSVLARLESHRDRREALREALGSAQREKPGRHAGLTGRGRVPRARDKATRHAATRTLRRLLRS